MSGLDLMLSLARPNSIEMSPAAHTALLARGNAVRYDLSAHMDPGQGLGLRPNARVVSYAVSDAFFHDALSDSVDDDVAVASPQPQSQPQPPGPSGESDPNRERSRDVGEDADAGRDSVLNRQHVTLIMRSEGDQPRGNSEGLSPRSDGSEGMPGEVYELSEVVVAKEGSPGPSQD